MPRGSPLPQLFLARFLLVSAVSFLPPASSFSAGAVFVWKIHALRRESLDSRILQYILSFLLSWLGRMRLGTLGSIGVLLHVIGFANMLVLRVCCWRPYCKSLVSSYRLDSFFFLDIITIRLRWASEQVIVLRPQELNWRGATCRDHAVCLRGRGSRVRCFKEVLAIVISWTSTSLELISWSYSSRLSKAFTSSACAIDFNWLWYVRRGLLFFFSVDQFLFFLAVIQDQLRRRGFMNNCFKFA